MMQSRKQIVLLLICLLLSAGTLLCYWQITRHGFVDFDDPQYISQNLHVKAGLTFSGIVWAFTTGFASNWHPLTWISHMLDCQLFGLNPAGHHFTNLLLHLADTLLLFFVLRQLTSSIWRSAAVAALFAWHPLHVESVAWASERKDVLSAFFFLLTIWTYLKYTEAKLNEGTRDEGRGLNTLHAPRSHASRSDPQRYYTLTLLFFALGLMSKPMLVTLPCVLLLLDFWPLGRFQLTTNLSSLRSSILPLLREKLPLFALTLLSSLVTYLVQRGARSSLVDLSLGSRLANAVVAYGRYFLKTFWPVDLAAIYPYSRHLPAIWVIGSAVLLLGLSVLFVLGARRRPWLLVGWLWFLGTLVPTIGLIQVGSQSIADRYMYIPSIGLFITITWGLESLFGGWPHKRFLLAPAMSAALAACLVCTWNQAKSWKDSETLFRRAIAVTSNNYIAYDGLGAWLNNAGRRDESLRYILEAVRMNPRYAEAQYDLGTVLMQQGKLDEAIPHFEKALRLDPKFASAHDNLGTILLRQGKIVEATQHFQAAARLNPEDPEVLYNLGTILLTQAQVNEGVACLLEAVRLRPGYAQAESNLGVGFARLGNPKQASIHFAAALRVDPNNPDAHFNLGVAYLEMNQVADAAKHLAEAVRLNPDAANVHYHLALALSRDGKSAEALSHAKKARDLAEAAGQTQLVAKADELLKDSVHP